jgi:hypothetical protein
VIQGKGGPPSSLRRFGETGFADAEEARLLWPLDRRGRDEARAQRERRLAERVGFEPNTTL